MLRQLRDAMAGYGTAQERLDRIVQLTRRKFEAFGYRGSLARWWPEVPDDFPEPGDIAQTIRRLDERIPEVQHQLIRFEQQRSGTQGLLNSTLDALREEGGGEIDPVLEQIARDQLALRRDLLDELILELRDALGMSIVVVTHELESAFRIADRITMLDQGNILTIGTVEELRSSENDRVQRLLNRCIEEEVLDPEAYLERLTGLSPRD